MSDDKSETIVPSTGNDEKLKADDASPSPPLPTPPSSTSEQLTLNKLGSLTNRILSPVSNNSSSSPTHISPIKSSCNSSTRRTFNICDILAKPVSSPVDNNNNTQLHHLIKKPKAHRLVDYTKLILEQKANQKSIYPHSDNDDDDDDPGSVSDCDISGKYE